MAIDIFDPREMTAAFEQIKPAPGFFAKLFGGERREYFGESVDIDISIGGREQAPFVLPGAPATLVDHRGFRTHSYTPPQIRLKGRIGAEHLKSRLPGEHIYEGRSPNDRKGVIVGKILDRLDRMIARREEMMIAEILQTGSLVVKDQDGNTLDTIAFGAMMDGSTGWATTHIASPAVRWDNATVANRRILENLRTWSRLLAEDSGKAPTDCLMGVDATDALLADAQAPTGLLHGMLDNRRVEVGDIKPGDIQGGVQYIGQIKGVAGIDLWCYSEKDAAGNYILDADKIVLGSRAARTEFRYGAVEKPRDDRSGIELVAGSRVSWGGLVDDPPQELVYLASRPLYVPIELGAFGCFDVMT